LEIDEDKLKYWHNRTILNIRECRDCKYALLCYGGFCPAYSFAKYKDLYKPACNNFPEVFELYAKFISNKILRFEKYTAQDQGRLLLIRFTQPNEDNND